MANQNFEGFKPLNEEEEKKVVGGNPANVSPCSSIEQQIQEIQQQIATLQRQHLPVPQGLQQTLQQFEMQYQQCEKMATGH